MFLIKLDSSDGHGPFRHVILAEKESVGLDKMFKYLKATVGDPWGYMKSVSVEEI